MQLKHTIVILAAAGMLSAQAYAGEMQVEAAIQTAQPLAAFTDAHIAALFNNANKPMHLAALSEHEMRETEGAWLLNAAGVFSPANHYFTHESLRDTSTIKYPSLSVYYIRCVIYDSCAFWTASPTNSRARLFGSALSHQCCSFC